MGCDEVAGDKICEDQLSIFECALVAHVPRICQVFFRLSVVLIEKVNNTDIVLECDYVGLGESFQLRKIGR
jgi:hypothetical protein